MPIFLYLERYPEKLGPCVILTWEQIVEKRTITQFITLSNRISNVTTFEFFVNFRLILSHTFPKQLKNFIFS